MIRKILFSIFLVVLFQIATAQQANTNISNGILFDGEPYLAINPANQQNLVVAWMGLNFSNGSYQIAIKTRASFDGGNSWSTTAFLPHFARREAKLLQRQPVLPNRRRHPLVRGPCSRHRGRHIRPR